MDEYKCVIDLKLPSLNEYIAICRANKYQAAKYKREIEDNISWFIKRLPRFEKPVTIDFIWIEANKKRDYDNIAFAKKFVLDALVKNGKLKNDNRKCVVGFSDTFRYSDKTKVMLIIKEFSQNA